MKFTNNKLKDMEKLLKSQERVIQKQKRDYEKLLKNIQKDKLKIEKNKKKELEKEHKKKHKKLMKVFNKTVRKDNAKLKYQNKKIKELEKKDNIKKVISGFSSIRIYFYVEKNKDENDEYGKKYAYLDNNKYQENNLYTKMYALCLESLVTVPNIWLIKYQLMRFYNKEDNGNEFVEQFKKYISEKNDDTKDRINIIQVSRDIEAFKILNITPFGNDNYEEPDILNDLMYLDDNKAVNNYYTKYKLNLEASEFKDIVEVEYNDYLKANFRPNCCLLTAIINKFYDRFNRIKADGKRRNRELTYDYLCEILQIENKKSNMGCSVNRVKEKFCEKFNFVGFYVYDCYNNCKLSHKPIDSDCSTLRVMCKDNHVYQFNDNLKSLEQKVDYSDDERSSIIVTNKYNVMKPIEEKLEIFCTSMKDILKAIKLSSQVETLKLLQIITNCDINNILFDSIDGGYTPKVYFDTHLYKISLKLGDLIIQIIPNHNEMDKGQFVEFANLKEYQIYHIEYNKFYDSVIKAEYLSDSHESVLEIDSTYPIKPVMGYFDEYSNRTYTTIDENKAYTECLQSIEQIPKFNYFDVYKPYNNEPLENLSYYIIEVLENTKRSTLLFDSKICRTFGYILKQTDIKYKIISFRNPLHIEDVNFRLPIQELYNSDLEIVKKKAIANITIGLLEKRQNKGELSKIFKDYNEANYYAIKYNGKILKLANEAIESNMVLCPYENKMIESFTFKEQQEVYLVKIQDSKKLINGFTPIKDMIYLNQKLKLLKQYDQLIKLDYKIVGIKTDCIFFEGAIGKIEKNFKLSNKIGDFKIEECKYLINKKIELEENELIEIRNFAKVEIKTFEDERDIKLMNKYITENKNILIKGLYPGVGKSTMCKDFDKSALFVCPYNKLCQSIRTEKFNSITYSKLFGLVGSDAEMKFMKQFDLSNYKTIVFDEIFLYEPQRLKRISELMKNNPDKYFMSTGDCDQRCPVSFNNSNYLNQCMNILFSNQVVLNEIKRFKNIDDKNRLIQIKEDVFNLDISIESICEQNEIKIIRKISDCKTVINIALFNKRCDDVNNHVHKNILKQEEGFKVGQEIICKKYEKRKGYILTTNYTYKIEKLQKAYCHLRDEVEDIKYIVPIGTLYNNFKLPYCLTVDSVQGLSFGEDEKITIFDANTPYVDRKFLWTALTRARKLDNVTICIHSNNEVTSLCKSRIRQYFNNKVESYKRQDKKVHREYDNKDFVDANWITEKIDECKYVCLFCKKHMELSIDKEGQVQTNITVDRINNKLAHIKSNSQMCCLKCNLSKGCRY